MPLNQSAITYIKFFTFLLPVILPTMAVISSFYEGNAKGLFYILGLILSMMFGGLVVLDQMMPPPVRTSHNLQQGQFQ